MFTSAIHVLCNEDKDDPSIARRIGKSYNNYGIMLLKQNSTNEAIRMLQQSREVRLNKDFLGLIRTNDLLYKLAVEEGKLNDAYTYLVEIIDAEEKFDIYGGGMLNDYVNHIDAFSNICIQLKKTNEGKNAYKKVFELALRIVKEYGSSNEGMRNVSIIYQRINKLFGTTDFLKQ